MKKILIIGKMGQVGWELQRTLATQGQVIAIDREQIDLADPSSIVHTIRDIQPNIIVNAAAYTAVDKAEQEKELALAINGIAPGILAEEAKRLGAMLVHYSTDYVYSGKASTPYCETDETAPQNIYGHSKLVGDLAIQAVGGTFLILRTSWVYAARGKNFLLTMLKLAKEREQLKIVSDQIGAPTWARLIAQATAQMLTDPQSKDKSGVYHLTAAGETSWHAFAQAIFLHSKQQGHKVPEVLPIPASEYPTPAKRPQCSVLSNGKLLQTFGIQMPRWDVGLDLCMQEFTW